MKERCTYPQADSGTVQGLTLAFKVDRFSNHQRDVVKLVKNHSNSSPLRTGLALLSYWPPMWPCRFLEKSRVGGPFISACSLKQGDRQTDTQADGPPALLLTRRPAIVFWARIYWVSGSLRRNLRAICLLFRSLLSLSLSLCRSPLRSLSPSHGSLRGGCDFNTILIPNHSTGEENIVPVPQNGPIEETFYISNAPCRPDYVTLRNSPSKVGDERLFSIFFMAICVAEERIGNFSAPSPSPWSLLLLHCYDTRRK